MAESIYQRIRANEHGKIAIPCMDGIRIVEWITADYDEFNEDVVTMYVEEPVVEAMNV